jgi:transposase
MPSTARHADPDFVPSLRLLVQRERYSHHDIALMFGVSRERVRQWCEKYEVAHPDGRSARGLRMTRVWEDASNRFVPVSKRVARAGRQRMHREQRQCALSERRDRIVEQVSALRSELGRDPTLKEIAERLVGKPVPSPQAGSLVMHQWGGRTRRGEYGPAIAALRNAAGIGKRARGEPGHVMPGSRSRSPQSFSDPRFYVLRYRLPSERNAWVFLNVKAAETQTPIGGWRAIPNGV